MKPCDHADALVSAYLEHETSPAETRFVEAHLGGCPRCRLQQREVETLLERLSSLPRVEPSPGFTDRVLARTAGMEAAGFDAPPIVVLRPGPRRISWGLPLAAAAALALAFLTVTQLGRSPQTPPQVAERTSPVAGRPEPTAISKPSSPEVRGPLPAVEALPGNEENAVPLGTARDAYVLEGYELRQPAGGGAAVLTPAAGRADARVVVTF